MSEAPAKPNIVGVISRAIKAALGEMRVSCPGRVTEYDSDTRRVSVQPLIKRRFVGENGERRVESLPIVHEVPIAFPEEFEFPIAVGDGVLLLFCDRSIDKWLENGGDVDPEDERSHHLTDAIAIPGLYASPRDPSVKVKVTDSEVQAGGTATLALGAAIATLKSVLAGWTPVAGDGGLALKTALNAAFGGPTLPGWDAETSVTKGS